MLCLLHTLHLDFKGFKCRKLSILVLDWGPSDLLIVVCLNLTNEKMQKKIKKIEDTLDVVLPNNCPDTVLNKSSKIKVKF